MGGILENSCFLDLGLIYVIVYLFENSLVFSKIRVFFVFKMLE